jgi:hypothetical protein
LDAQLHPLRTLHDVDELVLVEGEADMVDARQIPLARLDDHVDGAALELGQPEPESEPVEIVPGDAGLEIRLLVADPTVARDEAEAELRDVARLDVAHLARHQVVVEELHGIYARRSCSCFSGESPKPLRRC